MAIPAYQMVAGAHFADSGWTATPVATYRRSSRFYLGVVGLAMTTGTLVLIEPAPIDVALMGLLGWGLVGGHVAFRRAQGTPILLFGIIAVANLLSIINAADVSRAIWYCTVTMY